METGATARLVSAPRADGGRDDCGGRKAPLLKGTDHRHSHQRVGGAGKKNAPRRQKAPPPGMRPASLTEPQGTQVVFERHVAEQVHDAPVVPTFAAPVPHMVDKLDVLKILGLPLPVLPEHLTEMPKISSPSRCSRTVLSEPQMAGQLVEVPTLFSLAVLQQRAARQSATTPVPRGGHGRRSGFFPRTGFYSVFSGADRSHSFFLWRSTRFSPKTTPASQIVDILFSGGPHGFLSPDRVLQRLFGGLQGSPPGQGSTAPLGARVARRQGFHPGQGSTAPRGSDSPVGVQSLVPGQGSTAPLAQRQQVDQGSAVVEGRASGGPTRTPRQAGPTTTTAGPWRPAGRCCLALLLRRGRRRKGGGGRDARVRGPYSTALPDGGKRALVADTALWARTPLSPSPWYSARGLFAVCDPISAVSARR